MILRPFWRYYGGKWRAARHYPEPRYRTIVEPFAGAAGYALRYPNREVILVERYEVVVEVWRWLIGAPVDEVLSIPTVDAVADLPAWVPRGARLLIGFLMNSATTSPRVALSSGARDLRSRGRTFYGWSEAMRARVAAQVPAIRHWRVIHGDYSEAPDVEATWFVDPPYQVAGRHYIHGSNGIDYAHLAGWCRSRRGQPIVCEQTGADWLPFRHLMDANAARAQVVKGRSAEAVWP